MKDYYEILEVNPKASDEIIKKIYKIKIRQNHPDLFQGEKKARAEEITKEITKAYEVLSNRQKRQQYDMELESATKAENADKYINIISSLKSENDYLKQVISAKNNMINSISNEYGNTLNKDILNPEDSTNNNSNKTTNQNSYFFSVLSDMKQFLFKMLLLGLIILTLLVIFNIFTGNSILNILFNIN